MYVVYTFHPPTDTNDMNKDSTYVSGGRYTFCKHNTYTVYLYTKLMFPLCIYVQYMYRYLCKSRSEGQRMYKIKVYTVHVQVVLT